MGGKRFRTKAMRAQKVHISLLPLATLVAPILGQLQFNGGVSSSSNSNSNSANRNTNRPTSGDVDEKFFLRRRHTLLDWQPGLGRRHRGTWSWCFGSRCSRSHHPRCPQRGPTKSGLQLLWKEEEASQLWRKYLPWRSWSWRARPRRRGAVLLAHRPG